VSQPKVTRLTEQSVPGRLTVAVIYAAKSTEDKHGSIPDQLADCRAMAAREGWPVVAEDQDENESAYHGSRGDGLARQKAKAEGLVAEGRRVVLIVQHSDRLARGDGGKEAAHLVEFSLWRAKSGVEIRSVQDDATWTTPMGHLIPALMGERNLEDSRRKGLAVKDGIKRRAVERRQFIGGRRPFGYRHRDTTDDGRETGPLVIDQSEAAVVRRIFAEYLAGRAQNAIAVDLLHDKVPTLTGGNWYATTVAGMLKNPLYIGQVVHNGAAHPGSHEPIIDQATWEQACELRDGRTAQGRPRGRRTAGRHLLTERLLVCTCGASMSPVTKRPANGRVYEVYVCVRRLHHGPSACAEIRLTRVGVDAAIFDSSTTLRWTGMRCEPPSTARPPAT
jgi:DNA invertase Pin-like site-specific DNA recombinase